jgi:Ran GTPase-activating protein (RanGAP) involved in mRNA processing and transport
VREILDAIQSTHGATPEQPLLTLDLSRNRCLGRSGTIEVAGMLRGPLGRGLRSLNLAGCNMGPEGAAELGATLAEGWCPDLEVLRVGENMVGLAGGTALVQALVYTPGLKVLDLARANISTEGAAAMAQTVRAGALRHLEVLDLSLNYVREAGMAQLAAALVDTPAPALTHLNLAENQMGVEGAKSLAAMLRTAPKLELLHLHGNAIKAEGVQHVMAAVAQSLRVLDLSKNGMEAQGGMAVAHRLRLPGTHGLSRLEVLNLADNDLTAEATQSLAQELHRCLSLQRLNLSSNTIGEACAQQSYFGSVSHLVSLAQVIKVLGRWRTRSAPRGHWPR